MTTTPAPVLLARGLSKTFGGRTVLQNVDLDILPGEVAKAREGSLALAHYEAD